MVMTMIVISHHNNVDLDDYDDRDHYDNNDANGRDNKEGDLVSYRHEDLATREGVRERNLFCGREEALPFYP